MKSTLNQIGDIKNHGYNLDFSDVFNHAFENYKKIALYAGLILLVFGFLAALIFGSTIGAIFGIGKLSNDYILNFKLENLSQLYLVYYIGATALMSSLVAPFTAGFLKMAECADKDEEFNVSTIFTYYKTKHFAQIFIATILITLINNSISVFLEISNFKSLAFIISLLIPYFTFLTIPLIIFGNLRALDAIKSSFIIITKQPLVLLGLMLMIIVAVIIGFFGCCIGVLFTIPFSYSMSFAIYDAILGVDKKEDSIDSIGNPDLE